MNVEVESFQIETVHNNEQLQCMLEMKESVKELESTKDRKLSLILRAMYL